jgi:hypothetical protein
MGRAKEFSLQLRPVEKLGFGGKGLAFPSNLPSSSHAFGQIEFMTRRKNIYVEGGNDNFRINTFCRERENGGNKNCAWELNIWPMAIAAACLLSSTVGAVTAVSCKG